VLRQDLLAYEQRHHVAPRQVLHHEVQELFILERVVQLDYRVVLHLGQHVALSTHVVHLAEWQGAGRQEGAKATVSTYYERECVGGSVVRRGHRHLGGRR
jgi:hypothetical protein